jgi:hypothetical protein
MHYLKTLTATPKWVVIAGLLAGGLLLPGGALAAPAGPSGTLVGTIACGASEETHASGIMVVVEGMDLSTHSDGAGKYALAVPAFASLTIEALGGPGANAVASRYNVVVQPGQTLDIGNLDLSVCPQPAHDAEQQQAQEQQQDLRD